MSEAAPSLRKAHSVSDIVRRLKRLMEDNIKHVWIEGEISEYKIPSSGHHYFTLKDEESILHCVMWKGVTGKLQFQPEVGLEVLAYGQLGIYPPHGKYQFYVQKMEPKGLGALQLRFEELKKKLAKEGMFHDERKRDLPAYPSTIAIVTSPTGAAVRDMLRILQNRFPKITVLIFPVLVQGEGAADQISQAISEINLQRPEVDAMIVGRGGGSLEDLWAFNEEAVARAIFHSRIPIISAVGHETDFTIADFVADVRAATPTDAANRIVPELRELQETLDQFQLVLMRRPREVFELSSQRVDEFHERLVNALKGAAVHLRGNLDQFGTSLHAALPRLVGDRKNRLGYIDAMIHQRMDRTFSEAAQKVTSAAGRMEALSPLKVLGRGYSVTRSEQGVVIHEASRVNPGDLLETRLHKGCLRSRVEESFSGDKPKAIIPRS